MFFPIQANLKTSSKVFNKFNNRIIKHVHFPPQFSVPNSPPERALGRKPTHLVSLACKLNSHVGEPTWNQGSPHSSKGKLSRNQGISQEKCLGHDGLKKETTVGLVILRHTNFFSIVEYHRVILQLETMDLEKAEKNSCHGMEASFGLESCLHFPILSFVEI